MKQIISLGSQNTKTYTFKSHSHSYWEITYYYAGEGINITDGISHSFERGTIICQPPGLPHEDHSPDGYKNIYFLVENFRLSDGKPQILHDNASFSFLTVLQLLNSEFHVSGNNPLTESLLNVLFEYLICFQKGYHGNTHVELFERNLIRNFSNSQFSLEQQLKTVPYSKNHFRLLFEKETGMSPKGYLIHLRLSHAQKLLKNTTLTISDISELCGFSDPYYFSRLYHKYFGVSPRTWRNNNSIK